MNDAKLDRVEATDVAWMKALRREEKWALSKMYEMHREVVTRVVARIMGPDSETEDLVQEVFYHAIRGVARYRGDANGLRSWLCQIAVRRCQKRLRYRTIRSWLRWSDPNTLDSEGALVDAHTSMQCSKAWDVIGRLGSEERIVFSLFYVGEHSLDEITELTGFSRSTVKRRLHAARLSFFEAAKKEPMLAEWVQRGGKG